MRDHDGTLTFAPRLPAPLRRIAFRLTWRGSRFAVEVDRSAATYRLIAGGDVKTAHHGEPIVITAGDPVTKPIPPAPERPKPTQPHGRAPHHRG